MILERDDGVTITRSKFRQPWIGKSVLSLVFAVGFAGMAIFTATAPTAEPDKINVDAGNNQTGAVGQPLAVPFIAVDIGWRLYPSSLGAVGELRSRR